MRICYLNYEWDLAASTGAATQIHETVAGLARLGHEVHVIPRHRKPPSRPGYGERRVPNRWFHPKTAGAPSPWLSTSWPRYASTARKFDSNSCAEASRETT